MTKAEEKEYKAAWYQKNKERVKAARRKNYLKNKSHQDYSNAAWAKAYPEKARAIKLRWQRRNARKVQVYNAGWRKRNTELVRQYARMYNHRRRARLRNQLHPLHDKRVEKALFTECVAVSISTGQQHHVDHIIPLKVGGWHHHLNLQILPATINHRKSADVFIEVPSYKSWRDVPSELWPKQLAEEYSQRIR